MEVSDFEGHATIQTAAELDQRLRSIRKRDDGAFILYHHRKGPSLWIHVFKKVAYLHYFPGGEAKHPGFQATGMSPKSYTKEVRFLLVGGDEGSSIEMSPDTLVSLATAYKAAKEFLEDPALPRSVSWFEL